MTSPLQQDDEEEAISDPIKILIPDSAYLENGFSPPQYGTLSQQGMQTQQQHYLTSIHSTLLIRQLPSQGLSFQLWPAASTLVSLLDSFCRNSSTNPLSPTLSALSNGSDHRRALRILELGSGTGLVGIAAALTLGATVTVTDLPHVIPNLQFNVAANAAELALHSGTLQVAPLRWGEDADAEAIGREFDLVLASDVVYHDHLYEPLIKTLRFLLCGEKEVVFIMAHLKRWKKEAAFFKRAKKLFHVDAILVDSPREGCRVGVTVYRFTGKRKKLAQNVQ